MLTTVGYARSLLPPYMACGTYPCRRGPSVAFSCDANRQLEHRVADQVGEIERMSRLRRFLGFLYFVYDDEVISDAIAKQKTPSRL